MQQWEKKPRAAIRESFLGRIRSLASVDDAVAATVARLKQAGEFDDTIFLFASDNGFMNGEHRLTYKKWAFSENLRVPLIMTGPGVPKGKRTNRWVTMVDLSATILDAAGATSRRGSVDGRSFLAARPGSGNEPRPLLIGSGQELARNAQDKGWAYRGVMWGRYIWTKHWKRSGVALGEQFYDLVTDPYQIRSRPNAKQYQAVIKRMKAHYRKLRDCKGADCIAERRDEPKPG
jgi:N-acetylglucosamine-6-sulfatase